jgi:hypothetical protein
VIQVAKASALILLSAIAPHTAGFQRTINFIERLGRGRPRPAAASVRAIRRARSYGLFRGNCLSQSLALLWLLRRSGHDGVLRIGVKSEAGRLLSHAWVELDGETIDPAAISNQYVAFSGLPVR